MICAGPPIEATRPLALRARRCAGSRRPTPSGSGNLLASYRQDAGRAACPPSGGTVPILCPRLRSAVAQRCGRLHLPRRPRPQWRAVQERPIHGFRGAAPPLRHDDGCCDHDGKQPGQGSAIGAVRSWRVRQVRTLGVDPDGRGSSPAVVPMVRSCRRGYAGPVPAPVAWTAAAMSASAKFS